MSRQKKDGKRVSLFLDRQLMERLRYYADERGQTLTTAMERLVKAQLDAEGKKADTKNDVL